MFVCVECGKESRYLCEQISPSVLKLSQCQACDSVMDKYVEYDGVLILLDMLLLKSSVYRHIIYNRRNIGNDAQCFTKYSNETVPPKVDPDESESVYRYYRRLMILLYFSCLSADTYITWLYAKQTGGKLDLQVLELKFMVRLLQVTLESLLFYGSVMGLSYIFLGITDLLRLLQALILSSFAKLLALPSAVWSQNTNLLVLSYVLVLINNFIVLRVMSRCTIRSIVVVCICFMLERKLSYFFCQHMWPWDSLYIYNVVFRGSNATHEPFDKY